MQLKRLLNKKGETLIEVVVSLAILAILSVTFVSLLMGASGINLKAIRVSKEDTQISGVFDGDNFAGITPSDTTVSSPIVVLDFGGGVEIKTDGTYQEARGAAGEGVIIKRFVPN